MTIVAKTPTQLDTEIATALRAKKWQHAGGDRYESWWLGDEDAPIAEVHPMWNATRGHGIGKPDYWIAVVRDKRVEEPTISQAKKRAEAMLKEESIL